MARKRRNGDGSVIYVKARKKYRVRVTVDWDIDTATGKVKQVLKDVGSFKTRREADEALSKYLRSEYCLEDKNITFEELYIKWYAEFMTEEHKSYEYRLKSAYKYASNIHKLQVRKITVNDMKKCISDAFIIVDKGKYKGQRKDASPSTKESIKFMLNHVMQYAADVRLIERNYAKDFAIDKKVAKEKEANRKVKKPFTNEELNLIWKSTEFVPFADMVVYNCYSGWRASELVGLRLEDVHLEEGYIQGGIKTDAGKNRIVPIHSSVRSIVEKYYNEAIELESEYLFNDSTKKAGRNGLSYDQYLSRFNNVLEALGLRPEITPHYSRHTFTTLAKRAKMNDFIIKRIDGHVITDLTEKVYTHRDIQELKEEIELIKS